MGKEQLVKITPWLQRIVFVLLLVFYASFLIHPIGLSQGQDLPRLMQNGEDILAGHYEVLTKNFYSYTTPDHPFANHHWLSGVVYFLLHGLAGFEGLVVFKILVLLAAFAILFSAARKKAGFWTVVTFSIPVILLLGNRTFVRPEMFSYLFIAIYLYALFYLEQHPRSNRVWWLAPLQLLWVNLHLFFGIGILMTAGFLFEQYRLLKRDPSPDRRTLVKKLALLTLALIGVSFINPFGFRSAIFALQLNVGKTFPVPILETLSYAEYLSETSYWSDFSFALFIPLAILGLVSFLFVLGKRPIFLFLAFVGSALLSLQVLRAMPLFAMMFLPVVSFNLDSELHDFAEWLKRRSERVFHVLKSSGFVLLILGLVYLTVFDIRPNAPKYFGWHIGLSKHSAAAGEFFREHNLQGPIFNDPDVGSYLIYNVYPPERVFIDNRFGDAYSSGVFDVYYTALRHEDQWLELDEAFRFNTIFMYQYSQNTELRDFLFRRVDDPQWALVFADPYHVIFVKRSAINQDVIAQFEITPDNVTERYQELLSSDDPIEVIVAADVMTLLRQGDLAMETFRKIVARWPEIGAAWSVMGELTLFYIDEPDPELAITYFQRALKTARPTATLYSYLGQAYLQTGKLAEARAAFQDSLELDSDQPEVRAYLNELKKQENSF